MDTLFRFVSSLHSSSSSDHHHYYQQQQQQQQQQQSSHNSRSTSSSSRSSSAPHPQSHPESHHYYPYTYQDQECSKHHHHLYTMDEDDFSSSSSRHLFDPHQHHHRRPPQPSPTSSSAAPTPQHSAIPTPTYPSSAPLFEPAEPFPTNLNINVNVDFSGAGGGRWAVELLPECSRAVAARDSARVQQLMWMLNELASPYGDTEQKLASYFLQGLFAKLTSAGPRTLATLSSASDHAASFDSTRRTALRFQELSPWAPFGHVAANGAILEAFLEGSPTRLHILDLSTTFCTQWPTLLEALATRSSADDTPHLSITTVVPAAATASAAAPRVMKEVAARMERFARLMGVPFLFSVVHHPSNDLSTLDLDALGVRGGGAGEALAVNCVNALHGLPPYGRHRDALLAAIRRLQPRIVTIVEEEADLDPSGLDDNEAFLKGFREGLRFFSTYFDSLEESFPRTSNERLSLERAAGRAIVDLVSCPAEESSERRETAAGWSRRMQAAGFSPAPFSDDVADDIRALLRRYKEGWLMRSASSDGVEDTSAAGAGVFLAWKDQPVVWASAWRP